jgi:hypothetical protein
VRFKEGDNGIGDGVEADADVDVSTDSVNDVT